MDQFDKLEPYMIKEVDLKEFDAKGFVVIDQNNFGLATGGVRMAQNVTVCEVANLAHEMTLKYGFLKIKKDGAKAGIVVKGALNESEKDKVCQAFGKALSSLLTKNIYIPGEDLGINANDLQSINIGAGIPVSDVRHNKIKSEYFTALTVCLSVIALLKENKKDPNSATVIIEGFGKVGEQAAHLLRQEGVKVVGLSTVAGAIYDANGIDLQRMRQLKDAYGDQCVTHYSNGKTLTNEELLISKADVLIPGARPDSINLKNIKNLKTKYVVPIANIAVTQDIEEMLYNNKIIYIPGFVTNCGGVLAYFIYEQGFTVDTIESMIQKEFPRKVSKLINQAGQCKVSVAAQARNMVDENIQDMKSERKKLLSGSAKFSQIKWLLYKQLSRFKNNVMLKGFAEKYIVLKHLN